MVLASQNLFMKCYCQSEEEHIKLSYCKMQLNKYLLHPVFYLLVKHCYHK